MNQKERKNQFKIYQKETQREAKQKIRSLSNHLKQRQSIDQENIINKNKIKTCRKISYSSHRCIPAKMIEEVENHEKDKKINKKTLPNPN